MGKGRLPGYSHAEAGAMNLETLILESHSAALLAAIRVIERDGGTPPARLLQAKIEIDRIAKGMNYE